MFIITRVVNAPRNVERRESGSMFCETIEPFPEIRTNRVERMKTQRCSTLHWGSTLEYAHFIIICRYLLANTNEVSKLRTESRLRINFSLALPLRNCEDSACALLACTLAAHAKSKTLYGRSYGRKSKFFRFDGLLLFFISMELRCARFELRYNLSRSRLRLRANRDNAVETGYHAITVTLNLVYWTLL